MFDALIGQTNKDKFIFLKKRRKEEKKNHIFGSKGVEYFDLLMGAVHHIHWSKITFSCFRIRIRMCLNFSISNLILIKLHKKKLKKLSYMAKLIPIMLII